MEHLEHAALKALLTKGEPYIKRQLESAKAREAKAAAKVAKPKARTSPAGGAALGAVGGATGGVAPAAKRSRDPLSVVVVQPISGSTSLTSIVKALEGGALGAAKLKHLESQWPTAGHLADVAGDTHALQVGYDAIKAALALAEARGCVPPVSSIQALAQALREHLHGLAFTGITRDLFRDLGASPGARDSRVIWVLFEEGRDSQREFTRSHHVHQPYTLKIESDISNWVKIADSSLVFPVKRALQVGFRGLPAVSCAFGDIRVSDPRVNGR